MMRNALAGLIAGLLFGAGLALGGMTDPAVVTGFLDIAGAWNPQLMFVMAGGVIVTFIGYRLALKRPAPLWDERFALPSASAIDKPLIGGALIFGIGWGLAGYCPGPAVASLGSGSSQVIAFVIAMLVGMIVVRAGRGRSAPQPGIASG